MMKTLHPNELILTEQIMRDLKASLLTKPQENALKEQLERQKGMTDAASS